MSRPVPSDFADHATDTQKALGERYGVGKHTILLWLEAIGQPSKVRKWSQAETEHIRALIASGLNARAVAEATGHTRKAILEIVSRLKLGPWLIMPRMRDPEIEKPPADFVEQWHKMSHKVLARHYHRSSITITKWAAQYGLKRSSGVRVGVTPKAKRAPVVAVAKARPRAAHGAFVTAPVLRDQRDMSRVGQAADHLRKFGAVYRCTPMGAFDAKGSHWRRNSSILTDADIIERAEYNGWKPDAWMQVKAA